jgi:hypothetical protein
MLATLRFRVLNRNCLLDLYVTTPLLIATAMLLPALWGLGVSWLLARLWPPANSPQGNQWARRESPPFDFQI